jgi:hypothetical protein
VKRFGDSSLNQRLLWNGIDRAKRGDFESWWGEAPGSSWRFDRLVASWRPSMLSSPNSGRRLGESWMLFTYLLSQVNTRWTGAGWRSVPRPSSGIRLWVLM